MHSVRARDVIFSSFVKPSSCSWLVDICRFQVLVFYPGDWMEESESLLSVFSSVQSKLSALECQVFVWTNKDKIILMSMTTNMNINKQSRVPHVIDGFFARCMVSLQTIFTVTSNGSPPCPQDLSFHFYLTLQLVSVINMVFLDLVRMIVMQLRTYLPGD